MAIKPGRALIFIFALNNIILNTLLLIAFLVWVSSTNDPFFISKPKENKGSKSTGSQGTSGQSSQAAPQAAPEAAKNNSGGEDEFD